MNDAIFSQIDFGPLKEFLDEDNVTDISYSNGGQIHLTTLDKGVYRIERPEINNALMEKLAFQCSNVMGKSFNMPNCDLILSMILLPRMVFRVPSEKRRRK